MLTLFARIVATRWQELEDDWSWYIPGAELNIARYEITCMIIACGVAKRAKLYGWSNGETMVYM